MDNVNLQKINGYTVQKITDSIYAIDEFGTDIMYLAAGKEKAMLVDTGAGLGELKKTVETITDRPVFVVNTHGHMDHAMGNQEFGTAYMNERDWYLVREGYMSEERWRKFCLKTMKETYYTGPDLSEKPLCLPGELHSVKTGDRFDLGGMEFEVLEVPGHTPGSIALLDSENRILIAGDAVVSTPILVFDDYSTSVEDYYHALLEIEKRSDEFDLILPGHFLRPISKRYLYDLIRCAEKILAGTVDVEPEDFSHMTSAPTIKGVYGKASIVYNENHIR